MKATYAFDCQKFRLGTLCNRGHDWNSTGQSLRRNKPKGSCLECEKIYIARRFDSSEKAEHRLKYHREYMALHRPSRAKYTAEEKALCQSLRLGNCSPSVAQLVMQAQRLYWQEDPDAKRQHRKEWAQASWWLKYQINLDLRLYHREKKHRRKAKERGQSPLQVPVAALRQRFNEFSNCCAYCGQEGDMQMEHVEPIDKGGLHDIGNIVPACLSCNYSKRTSEMESWYRRQPFFSELRLARIRRVVRRPEGAQLAFALA